MAESRKLENTSPHTVLQMKGPKYIIYALILLLSFIIIHKINKSAMRTVRKKK